MAKNEDTATADQGRLAFGSFAGRLAKKNICINKAPQTLTADLFALQEIKMQEGDCSFLAAELKQLLDKDMKAKEKQPDAPKLEYMIGLVKDLFLDWQRFSGSVTSSKVRLGQLTDLLHSAETDSKQITEFIVNVQ